MLWQTAPLVVLQVLSSDTFWATASENKHSSVECVSVRHTAIALHCFLVGFHLDGISYTEGQYLD